MIRGLKAILDYLLSIFKVSSLLLLALFMPRLFLYYIAKPASTQKQEAETTGFNVGLKNNPYDVLPLESRPKKQLGFIADHIDMHQKNTINTIVSKSFK